jgi:hypothetical protein
MPFFIHNFTRVKQGNEDESDVHEEDGDEKFPPFSGDVDIVYYHAATMWRHCLTSAFNTVGSSCNMLQLVQPVKHSNNVCHLMYFLF